ncbi:hypothetical protein AB1Y20_003582 [Prymnesium parvum]|uniref:GRIP domain-containing protein n=1 Tax=Prymnesium parvum TaxID=97485 RepID=A0AB34J540_PRYPA
MRSALLGSVMEAAKATTSRAFETAKASTAYARDGLSMAIERATVEYDEDGRAIVQLDDFAELRNQLLAERQRSDALRAECVRLDALLRLPPAERDAATPRAAAAEEGEDLPQTVGRSLLEELEEVRKRLGEAEAAREEAEAARRKAEEQLVVVRGQAAGLHESLRLAEEERDECAARRDEAVAESERAHAAIKRLEAERHAEVEAAVRMETKHWEQELGRKEEALQHALRLREELQQHVDDLGESWEADRRAWQQGQEQLEAQLRQLQSAPAPSAKEAVSPPSTEMEAPPPSTEMEAPPPSTEMEAPPPSTEMEAPPPSTEMEAPPPSTEMEAPPPSTEMEAPPPSTEMEAPPPAMEEAVLPASTEKAAPPVPEEIEAALKQWQSEQHGAEACVAEAWGVRKAAAALRELIDAHAAAVEGWAEERGLHEEEARSLEKRLLESEVKAIEAEAKEVFAQGEALEAAEARAQSLRRAVEAAEAKVAREEEARKAAEREAAEARRGAEEAAESLAGMEEELAAAHEANGSLAARVLEAQLGGAAKARVAEEAREEVEARLEEAKAELAKIRAELDEREHSLQTQLRDATARAERALVDCSGAQQRCEEAERELAELKASVEAAEAREERQRDEAAMVSELKERLAAAEARAAALEAQLVEALNASEANGEKETRGAEEARAEVDIGVTRASEQLVEATRHAATRLRAAEEQKQAFEEERAQLLETVAKERTAVRVLRGQVAECDKEAARVHSEAAKSKSELAALRRHMLEKEVSVESQEHDHASMLAARGRELAAANAALLECQAREEKAAAHAALLEAAAAAAERRCVQHETALANLNAVLDEMQAHASLAPGVEQLRVGGGVLTRELRAVEALLPEWEAGRVAVGEVGRLRAREAAVGAEMAALREEAAGLQATLQASKAAQLQDNSIDKSLVASLITKFYETGCKREVLAVLASILDCSHEQRISLGLESGADGAFVPLETQKLSDMWVDFLMNEADQRR